MSRQTSHQVEMIYVMEKVKHENRRRCEQAALIVSNFTAMDQQKIPDSREIPSVINNFRILAAEFLEGFARDRVPSRPRPRNRRDVTCRLENGRDETSIARAYPGLILEAGKMKKKISRGVNSHFFLLKNTNFF